MLIPVLLALSVAQDSTVPEPAGELRRLPTPAQLADAYRDSAVRSLVVNARARRERAERLVTGYQVTVKQRIGVGIRALRRDRMVFGQEIVADIDWQRDGPTRLTVRGARQRVPVAIRGDHVPDDLDAHVKSLVFDPAADHLRLIGGDEDDGFSHPLREGSEADYRFSSGDTTTVTLPDGRMVRVLELRVEPRRAEFRLIAGSFWFDADNYGVVRAVFRPARPFEFRLDVEADDRDDVPGWVNPRAELRHVTVEYGLFDFRWWLPRLWALDAEAEMANIRAPVRFERVYQDYTVRAGPPPAANARPPAGTPRWRDQDRPVENDSARHAVEDCVRRRLEEERAGGDATRRGRVRWESRWDADDRWQRRCRREVLGPWPVEVTVAGGDTAALLVSADLGQPILQMGDVITEAELRRVAAEIDALPERPWRASVRLPDSWHAVLRHARYNRVEALSLGVGGRADFGRLRLDALGRLGIADREPNFEAGVTRPTAGTDWRVAGYRRLEVANPDTRPLQAMGSLNALFLGRDDGEYFRATGVEVTGRPGLTRGDGWTLRWFYERQTPAVVETDWSLAHALDRSAAFRPNIDAAPAAQYGMTLALRGVHAFSTAGTFGADVALEGQRGDYALARGRATLRATVPIAGAMLAVEAGTGTSVGSVPVQSQWFLGGPATLRGYHGGVLRGEAFWRGRAEIGTSWPALRGALFNDWGWAGPRGDFG
ncbi:MAG TPA: hypothetical protein VD793_04190, partial [Gemmatimonadales bacterium]|nr:hypothetical protein [Gemmatimonadales bacterium]